MAFIATFKEILLQLLREKGIPLTEEAVNRLDDLPSMIREFIADLRKAVAFQLDGSSCPLFVLAEL